jgi:hypothetical protein
LIAIGSDWSLERCGADTYGLQVSDFIDWYFEDFGEFFVARFAAELFGELRGDFADLGDFVD